MWPQAEAATLPILRALLASTARWPSTQPLATHLVVSLPIALRVIFAIALTFIFQPALAHARDADRASSGD